jgi:hypothetical protein
LLTNNQKKRKKKGSWGEVEENKRLSLDGKTSEMSAVCSLLETEKKKIRKS